MKFSETVKDAADLLKTAIPEMTQHKVPVNPYNYGIWYAYASGTYQGLNKELQQLLKAQGSITPQQTLDLYKKYIINDLLVVDKKLEDSYQSVMNSMSESANKTQQSTGDLEKQLAHSLKQLDDPGTQADLRAVINTIAEKTRLVSKNTQDFHHVLDDAQHEITRLKKELKEARAAAETDPLTKLYNRRHFDSSLSMAFADKDSSNSLALLLVDIDHFKQFNDNYGHLMGDLVLKAISQVLHDACEETHHIPCRFGGEEFAILMPKTTMREAKILAENTLKRIASLTLKDKKSGTSVSKVTASLGLSFAGPDDTELSLIDRADKALYKAKDNGRNQVVSL